MDIKDIIAYLKTKSAVILWDVEAMRRDIDELRMSAEIRRMLVVNLMDLYHGKNLDVDNADISYFPIVAALSKDKYCVLEGAAQIEKARLLHFVELECFFIKPAQQKKYILDYDEETYLRAVKEYWADEDFDDEDE